MNLNHKMVIIAAPSGAGKTSITHYLLKQFPQLAFSISAATRSPRGNEQHGVDYYFITENEFKQRIDADEFLEWEMVYTGKYYGTLRAEIERIWKQNQVPVLDVDVKGAIHVKQSSEVQVLSIFIMPPSLEVLKVRLTARNTDSAEQIEARLSKAAYEMSFSSAFDYVIINDQLQPACQEAAVLVQKFLDL